MVLIWYCRKGKCLQHYFSFQVRIKPITPDQSSKGPRFIFILSYIDMKVNCFSPQSGSVLVCVMQLVLLTVDYQHSNTCNLRNVVFSLNLVKTFHCHGELKITIKMHYFWFFFKNDCKVSNISSVIKLQKFVIYENNTELLFLLNLTVIQYNISFMCLKGIEIIAMLKKSITRKCVYIYWIICYVYWNCFDVHDLIHRTIQITLFIH